MTKAGTGQYLLFSQGGSRFALDLKGVREVLCLAEQQISQVPNTLPFVLGLTNLRGEILAVADLGYFLGTDRVDIYHADSRILICEIPEPRDVRLRVMRMGLAVSHVEGVVPINPDQIVSAVEVSEELVPFLKGLYDYDGRLLMILDVEAIALFRRW